MLPGTGAEGVTQVAAVDFDRYPDEEVCIK
jgi:hypothetical protein